MLERFKDRNDAQTWAHPELRVIHDMFNTYSGSGMDYEGFIFNPDVPYEERAEFTRNFNKERNAGIAYDETRTTSYQIPGCEEEPDAPLVEATVTKPANPTRKMKCILSIPGGGMLVCSVGDLKPEVLSDEHDCVVVHFGYRSVYAGVSLTGYPAAVNDCHAVYKWTVEHAEELDIDPDMIIIDGISTGGHLALALCHRLKRYGYRPRGCVAKVPIADNRMTYRNSAIQVAGWGADLVYLSSKTWLHRALPHKLNGEAFANYATEEECVGLPPTVIITSDMDPNADACMDYTSKLISAGVFVSLHLWGGSIHGTLSTAAMVEEVTDYSDRYLKQIHDDIVEMWKYDLRRNCRVKIFGWSCSLGVF
jgi:acetyl esterase/lipase